MTGEPAGSPFSVEEPAEQREQSGSGLSIGRLQRSGRGHTREGTTADDGLIDDIYEAAFLPERWPAVLDGIAALSGSAGAALFTSDHTRVARWTASPAVVPVVEGFISGGWITRNPRDTPAAQRHGFARFGTDLDFYTAGELEREPMYASLLRPLGFGWFAGTLVKIPNGDMAVFDIERRYLDGPMPRREVQRLDVLRPHLARAAVMSARLGFERARTQVETLAALGLPAAVVGRGGRVLAANALLQRADRQVVIRAFDRISLVRPAGQLLLADTLARIEAGSPNALASIPLPAAGNLAPAVAHLVPVRRQAHDVLAQALALFVLTPLSGRDSPSAELLAGLFDLTPAEARVARALVEGRTVDDAAAESGVSRETVRTQLRAVLAKTGTSRQAELVGLLGGAAAGSPIV